MVKRLHSTRNCNLHVVHLPRVLETFLLSLHGCSRDETGVLGKWRAFNDSQSLSYDKLPDTNLLAKVAGFTCLSEYKPFWIQLQPPAALISCVLACFEGQLEQAKKVNHLLATILYMSQIRSLKTMSNPIALVCTYVTYVCPWRCSRSRCLHNSFDAQIQEDTAAVQCLKYIESLRDIFVLAAPFIKKEHPLHPLSTDHALIGHNMWVRWENLQIKHCEVMDVIDRDLQSHRLGCAKFSISINDDTWTIRPRLLDPSDQRFDAHAKRLTAFINQVTQISPSVCEITQPHVDDKDSRDVLIGTLQTHITRLQQAILYQEKRSCYIESRLLQGDQSQERSAPSVLSIPSPLTRATQSPQRKSAAKKHPQKRDSELNALPPLSVVSNLPNPIQYLRSIWTQTWVHAGREHRPLKEIVYSKNPSKNRTNSRGIANQLKRIRYLMIVIDLLEKEQVLHAEEKFNRLLK
eukprot:g6356.t1